MSSMGEDLDQFLRSHQYFPFAANIGDQFRSYPSGIFTLHNILNRNRNLTRTTSSKR